MGAIAEPLVSIITITFNSERYLEETIKSVIEQDYPSIEYIIVDGGSTDNTLKIIEKYKNKIAKFVSEPDEGISDAMNKGIKMASGDIIGIIHSDDFYADPTVVRRVVGIFLQNEEVKAVYGIQDFIDPVTKKTILTIGRAAKPKEIRKRMYIPHPTLFVRKEVYDKIGLFKKNYRAAMDYEWAIRLTEFTEPYYLNYKMAYMRDMGTSGRQYTIVFKETIKALYEHGYYIDAGLTIIKNIVKMILIGLGFKGVLYKIWARNASP